MKRLIFAVLILAAFPAVAQEPEVISGPAVALDGDTLLVDGGKVRLFGIDAPEMRGDWPHGARARAALDDLLAGGAVSCRVIDTDRHKRPVAICTTAAPGVGGLGVGSAGQGHPRSRPGANQVSGIDLSAALLARGQAVVDRRFTQAAEAPADLAARYDAAERAARAGGLGIWAPRGAPSAAEAQGGFLADWRLWSVAAAFFGFTFGTLIKFGFDLWLDHIRRDKENRVFAIAFRAELRTLIAEARVRLDKIEEQPERTITVANVATFDLPTKDVYANNTDRLGGLGGKVARFVVYAHASADHIRHIVATNRVHPSKATLAPGYLLKFRSHFLTLIRHVEEAHNALDGFLGDPEKYPVLTVTPAADEPDDAPDADAEPAA